MLIAQSRINLFIRTRTKFNLLNFEMKKKRIFEYEINKIKNWTNTKHIYFLWTIENVQ